MRGRQREHSALMGWPDDSMGDSMDERGRDDHPYFGSPLRAIPFDHDAATSSDRDPQRGFWDE